MSRRLLIALSALLLATLATPAFAHSQLVAKKTSKKPSIPVYLSHRLKAGHLYQVTVNGPRGRAFQGYGLEQYTYVQSGHLYEGSKTFSISGKSSQRVTLTQPLKGSLSSWVLAVDVTPFPPARLTVKLLDLGKQK